MLDKALRCVEHEGPHLTLLRIHLVDQLLLLQLHLPQLIRSVFTNG